MKKKLISILTVALSCMLVLGGCGGKGKTTEKTPDDTEKLDQLRAMLRQLIHLKMYLLQKIERIL